MSCSRISCVFLESRAPSCRNVSYFILSFVRCVGVVVCCCVCVTKDYHHAEGLNHKNSCRIIDDKYERIVLPSHTQKKKQRWMNNEMREQKMKTSSSLSNIIMMCARSARYFILVFPFLLLFIYLFFKSNHVYEMRICMLGSSLLS